MIDDHRSVTTEKSMRGTCCMSNTARKHELGRTTSEQFPSAQRACAGPPSKPTDQHEEGHYGIFSRSEHITVHRAKRSPTRSRPLPHFQQKHVRTSEHGAQSVQTNAQSCVPLAIRARENLPQTFSPVHAVHEQLPLHHVVIASAVRSHVEVSTDDDAVGFGAPRQPAPMTGCIEFVRQARILVD